MKITYITEVPTGHLYLVGTSKLRCYLPMALGGQIVAVAHEDLVEVVDHEVVEEGADRPDVHSLIELSMRHGRWSLAVDGVLLCSWIHNW